MRQIATLVIMITIFSSCIQNTSQSTDANKIDTTGNYKIDLRLKEQLNEYLTAFNGGDVDKAISLCYPDMFVYLKTKYPEDYSIGAIKESFKEAMKSKDETEKELKADLKFKLGEITKCYTSDKDRIYSIETFIYMKKNLDEVSFGGEIVAISNDNGQNWTFVQKDSVSTPLILKMKYSDDIIQKVMAKK